ncbi:MAG: MFS transporter [Spirochaetales bacterium]|nr:MFS transporter [Spirochaetales bacterium]
MTSNKITKKEFDRSLKITILGGCTFTIWFSVCSPQPIFNVFFTNHLGATSSQLGLLIGIVQLATLFNILGIIVYGKLETRKTYFTVMHIIHRFLGILLAFVSFYVAKTGNNQFAIKVIIIGFALSWMLSNSSGAGWWSWMADLIPDNIRASFFGQRSSIMNIVNIVWFMGITVVLDTWTSVNLFTVYGIIFSIASIGGLLDIVLFIWVPEPKQKEKEQLSLDNFFEPLKEKNFIIFSVGIGITVFAINVFAPFTAPYITAKSAIGAPNTWLGIMFVISQLTWILVSPSWGIIMDKFGRKPVLMIGCVSTFSNLFYMILTPNNYTFILPLIAISGGLLAPALWDGINQMMLSLTPTKNRTAYIAWNTTIVGLVSAGGAYVGGALKDATEGISIQLPIGMPINNIHIILLLSLVLIVLGLLLLSTVKENKSRPLRFVVSRVVRPGIFRTFTNMGRLSGSANSNKIEKSLRSIDSDSDDIAVDDIIERLYDPDSEVREEAARALGRIKSTDAIPALIKELQDPESTIRSQAAVALGKIGDHRALHPLFTELESASDELQRSIINALGMLGTDESVKNLLKLFRNAPSTLTATGAVAISQLGALEAAWDIIPQLHNCNNPVLTGQLAISIGNLLGTPGEFYKYITGNDASRDNQIKNLFSDIVKSCEKLSLETNNTKLNSDIKKRIAQKFKKSEDLFSEDKYLESFNYLKRGITLVVSAIVDPKEELEQCEYLEKLYPMDSKTGIWWWLMTQAEEFIADSSDEVIKMDILLAVYYLSKFKGKLNRS